MAIIGVPLALGWVAQVLIGSWTHLVPAIGPGDQAAHAIQRRRLGRWGTVRVVSWNAAVAALTLGALLDVPSLVSIGAITLAAEAALAVGLLLRSIRHAEVGQASTIAQVAVSRD